MEIVATSKTFPARPLHVDCLPPHDVEICHSHNDYIHVILIKICTLCIQQHYRLQCVEVKRFLQHSGEEKVCPRARFEPRSLGWKRSLLTARLWVVEALSLHYVISTVLNTTYLGFNVNVALGGLPCSPIQFDSNQRWYWMRQVYTLYHVREFNQRELLFSRQTASRTHCVQLRQDNMIQWASDTMRSTSYY